MLHTGGIEIERRETRSTNMDAIIGRGTAGSLDLAAAEWLKATRRLARLVLAAILDTLVNTSRAGLLVRGGARYRRRF